jgi:hypothetical protein
MATNGTHFYNSSGLSCKWSCSFIFVVLASKQYPDYSLAAATHYGQERDALILYSGELGLYYLRTVLLGLNNRTPFSDLDGLGPLPIAGRYMGSGLDPWGLALPCIACKGQLALWFRVGCAALQHATRGRGGQPTESTTVAAGGLKRQLAAHAIRGSLFRLSWWRSQRWPSTPVPWGNGGSGRRHGHGAVLAGHVST